MSVLAVRGKLLCDETDDIWKNELFNTSYSLFSYLIIISYLIEIIKYKNAGYSEERIRIDRCKNELRLLLRFNHLYSYVK